MLKRQINDFKSWRAAARELISREIRPDFILWQDGISAQKELPFNPELKPATGAERPKTFHVPTGFIELARLVACHRDPGRWDLLYQVLWRITHGEPHVLQIEVDELVNALRRMEQAVRRDLHKMHAFVRFEKRTIDDHDEYLAYYRPDHKIYRLAASFFVDRFRSMRWTIFGPDETAAWDGERLEFLPGREFAGFPGGDELTQLWKSYYAAAFNPARLNERLMRREMPARFWPLLPEVADVDSLVAGAPARAEQLVLAGSTRKTSPLSAKPFIPAERNLDSLAAAARVCQGCPLYANATQTVFGEGPFDAPIVFVGEQPGDLEDIAGHPFVGPAGQLFNELLAEAGIERSQTYVTNTVKHFKWVPRGKRRLHSKPSSREIYACRPWLEAELDAIKPQALVLLGATAAQAILGPQFRVQRERGQPRSSPWSDWTIATYHPSAILRAGDAAHALHVREALLADLKLTAAQLSPFQGTRHGQEKVCPPQNGQVS